jgi:putative ABC transport system permease protein
MALANSSPTPGLPPALLLAWSNLTHSKKRMALSAAGIAFAVILMFVQYGCLNALLDSNLLLIDRLNTDLVLVSSKHRTVATSESFPEVRLQRVRGVGEVASVHPLAIENGRSRLRNLDNPVDNTLYGSEDQPFGGKPGHPIRVIGIDPGSYPLTLPELDPNDPKSPVHLLDRPGAVLIDRKSKKAQGSFWSSVYGRISGPPNAHTEVHSELARRGIEVVGTFALGSDFGTDGTLIVSRGTFGRWVRQPFSEADPYYQIEMGLIRLRPGADLKAAQENIRSLFPAPEDDVEVLTIPELKDRETAFWLHNTPIGSVFGMGMAMGFLVGLVICYQILASDVMDNLPQYATLKAIGYGNGFLVAVVLWQAVALACVGFVAGLLVSFGIYEGMGWATGLPMALNALRISLVLGLTLVLCLGAGVLALSGVLNADPAEVFG